MFLAANLVEMLRPLVEGIISQEEFAHQVETEWDALKSLPLGAQIMRCVGRAYRHSGQRVLRRHRRNRKSKKLLGKPLQLSLEFTDGMRETLRNAQHIVTAAMASGKLVWTEQASKYRKEKSSRMRNIMQDILPAIGYHMHDESLYADEVSFFFVVKLQQFSCSFTCLKIFGIN